MCLSILKSSRLIVPVFIKISLSFVLILTPCFVLAYDSLGLQLLDSLNLDRAKKEGTFDLYIKKLKAECVMGLYRNRMSNKKLDFRPMNYTYNIYMPFQYELNYLNTLARDKIFVINPVFIIHHSNYGNYGLGFGSRFGFLLLKKTYLSGQLGIAWFETVNHEALDGLNKKGLNCHSSVALSYAINKIFEISMNIIHVSNGDLFKSKGNLQDVLGLGISYQIPD